MTEWRHSNRELYLIAAVSLIVVFALRYASVSSRLMPLIGFQNVYFSGLGASVAIIGAFVPDCRFVGLMWTVAYSLAYGAVRSLADRLARGAWDDSPFAMAIFSLAILVVAQSLRYSLGWRITRGGQDAVLGTGQFRLLDALEWTTSIATWFGFAQFWELPLQNARGFATITAESLLICMPIALAATRDRGITFWTVVELVIWAAALRLLILSIGVFTSTRPIAANYWNLALQNAAVIPAWFLSAGVIFGCLYRVGYRWQAPRKGEFVRATT
jgi:hypothetical protein